MVLELDKILENYVSQCPICAQNSKTIHRLAPVKPIIVEGPNYISF